MVRSKLGIVIPAYNEAGSIGKVIEGVQHKGQVIVVNDCSSDNTAELSKKLGAIVVDHPVNKGYDAALNTGLAKANDLGITHVVTFDADGQHDTGFVDVFFKLLCEENYEVVVGTRSSFPRFAERLMAVYFNLRFSIKDPLCGMKGYDMNLWREYGQCFSRLNAIGTELLHFACLNKKRIKQINTPIYERTGTSRFGASFRANYSILKALFKLIVN